MPTVYKVVQKRDEKLYSAYHFDTEFSLEYIPGQFTKPKIGRLFAFKNLIDAEKYNNNMFFGNTEIWEAYSPKTFEAPDYILGDGQDFTEETICDYWNKGIRHSSMPLPQGTILCSSIRLIQKIDLKE